MPEFLTLMPIRTKGSGPPIFFIHGEPLRMAQRMEPNRPIYGLSHVYHADFIDESPDSIESLAATYLSEIRQVQPNGPYHFCGFSAGGMIAFEIAKQLRSVGESVGALTLIEPTIFVYNSVTQRVFANIGQSDEKFNYIVWLFSRMPKSMRARTRNLMSRLIARFYFAINKPLPDNMRWLGYLKSLGPAMRKYKYQPIDCKAVLLYRFMSESDVKACQEYWSKLFTQGADVRSFANVATHQEFMLDPALNQTVAIIERPSE